MFAVGPVTRQRGQGPQTSSRVHHPTAPTCTNTRLYPPGTALYDGLTIKLTPLGEDPEPHPEEGDPVWDFSTARSRHLIDDELYAEWAETQGD